MFFASVAERIMANNNSSSSRSQQARGKNGTGKFVSHRYPRHCHCPSVRCVFFSSHEFHVLSREHRIFPKDYRPNVIRHMDGILTYSISSYSRRIYLVCIKSGLKTKVCRRFTVSRRRISLGISTGINALARLRWIFPRASHPLK